MGEADASRSLDLLATLSHGANFALGCYWGAERKFWQVPGVISTAVGFAGGTTPNPTYREVCSGLTGHNEVVRVVFDPRAVSSKGAQGLMQLMPGTASRFKVRQIEDPVQNIRGGMAYLRWLLAYFEGDLALAMLAEARATVRPDLRLGIMSATLDPGPVSARLGGPRSGRSPWHSRGRRTSTG